MNAERIVATLILTQSYRRWRYERTLRITGILATLLTCALLATTLLWDKPFQVKVLQTDILGRIQRYKPLSAPNVDDEQLLRWTTDAVTKIWSYDFLNYRKQMQDSKRLMTKFGQDNFDAAIRDSGNFDSVLKLKYVVTAAPAGPATILWKGQIPVASSPPTSRYGWRVEVPIVVTYQSSQKEIAQRLSIEVTVGRLNEQVSGGSGLGIRQMIAR